KPVQGDAGQTGKTSQQLPAILQHRWTKPAVSPVKALNLRTLRQKLSTRPALPHPPAQHQEKWRNSTRHRDVSARSVAMQSNFATNSRDFATSLRDASHVKKTMRRRETTSRLPLDAMRQILQVRRRISVRRARARSVATRSAGFAAYNLVTSQCWSLLRQIIWRVDRASRCVAFRVRP